MQQQPDGSFQVSLRVPAGGYLGVFGEVDFGAGRGRYSLATDLRLVGAGGVVPVTGAEGPGVAATR